MGLALLSSAVFAARGVGVLLGAKGPMAPLVRRASQAIDTALLAAALLLLATLGLTNVLNATSASSYAMPSGMMAGSYSYGQTQAALAVQSSQSNSASVSVSSVDDGHQVALNSGGFAQGPAFNSIVNVSSNTLAAKAFGNSATNAVTVNSLGNTTPIAAVGYYQMKSDAVSASVSFGIDTSGGTFNSALRASGNQDTVRAIGNLSVSSIQSAR